VPFGWNSWGKVQTALNYTIATGVSDYIADSLTPNDFVGGNGTVYVNLDSYWDNLSEEQLGNFVDHCKANGQKAGIYWAPFVDWGKSASRVVEGTSYTYGEIWLRNGSGGPIELDGAYAIDPSHPGTLARIDHFIDRFKTHGFEYLKLDFLTHGALESSVRHDASVQTGIEAYNLGMRHIVERVAGTMFISESIAPLFPHGYAHARRVACDTYGATLGLTSTHYLMNSVTYGWWMSGTLYALNDPDHMVFDGFAASDNMARVISGVISGTVFLSGDDLTQANGRSLSSTYLTNPRLNAVARLGRTFRPLEGNTGSNPSDVFVLHHGGAHYVAVFNFGGSTATRVIDLPRAGFSGSATYTVTDLWTNGTSSAQGTLNVSVASHSAKLLSLQ
jgi:alpha-galactosidase